MWSPTMGTGPAYTTVDGARVDDSAPSSSEAAASGHRLVVTRRTATTVVATLALSAASAAAAVALFGARGSSGLRRSMVADGELQEKAAAFGYTKFAPPYSDQMEACGPLDPGFDYKLDIVRQLFNVGSASMCCAACGAYEDCGAWTWGSARHTDWLTNVCWLKALAPGDEPVKVKKDAVISGLPAKGVAATKGGASPPPLSSSEKLDGVKMKLEGAQGSSTGKCPGELSIEGHGTVHLINAGGDTPGKPSGQVEALLGDLIVPHMSGRTYFGDSCQDGPYDPSAYSALNLLGKTMSWTTDVSGTGCGCNAAFYLVSMSQNTQKGTCGGDFYCDAMSVCGVPCAEIDLQEANMYSWMSTLHTFSPAAGADTLGVGSGYGGSVGEPERRDWTAEEYGPNARCIDTTRPFEVSLSFPVGFDGNLEAMELKLSQAGQPCDLNARTDQYTKDGHRPFEELSGALKAGMTPVMSYWKSEDMLWMDGLGADGRGPCVKDAPEWCPDTVRFYEFSLRDIGAGSASTDSHGGGGFGSYDK